MSGTPVHSYNGRRNDRRSQSRVAIAGLVFAGLFVLGWVLLHQRPPLSASDQALIDYFADPAPPAGLPARRPVSRTVRGDPFIWFMAALRARYIGGAGGRRPVWDSAHHRRSPVRRRAVPDRGVELAMAWMVDTAADRRRRAARSNARARYCTGASGRASSGAVFIAVVRPEQCGPGSSLAGTAS